MTLVKILDVIGSGSCLIASGCLLYLGYSDSAALWLIAFLLWTRNMELRA